MDIKKLARCAGHAIGSLSLYTFFDFCARLRCDTINYPRFIQKVIQNQDIFLPPRGLIIHYDRWAANVVNDSVRGSIRLLSGFDIPKIFYGKIYEGAIATNNSLIGIAMDRLSQATGLPDWYVAGAGAVFLVAVPTIYLIGLACSRK